jgi:4-hydroxythreonine-4-phosphate dehydrogenase
MKSARLALSIGCPCGIGPEVSVEAAVDASRTHRVLLVGAWDAVERAARAKRIDRARLVRVNAASEAWALPPREVGVWNPLGDRFRSGKAGHPTPRDGAAQLAWIDAACDLAARGEADAMVTGPVSKEIIASSGVPTAARFLGHTEHLQRRLHAREVVMAFWCPQFTTSLVTTHVPLSKVPRAITESAVARATYWTARFALSLRVNRGAPRIAVCALNPHAGEGGLLGLDEPRAIIPGIALARARLADPRVTIDGPLGAETAFRRAKDGRYDGVVAMYHDQATIPMKLVGFGESVNVSLALPIIRTSVDHGTAYDIAGKGIADARGMREAIALAARMVNATRAETRGASPTRSRSYRSRTPSP